MKEIEVLLVVKMFVLLVLDVVIVIYRWRLIFDIGCQYLQREDFKMGLLYDDLVFVFCLKMLYYDVNFDLIYLKLCDKLISYEFVIKL